MITKKLGKRLRDIRKEQGVSQENLALKIGVDRTYYSKIETGATNVSIELLNKIAIGLNVSLEKIFKNI